jgi:arylsulfatase A-like enzyme
MFKRFSLFAGGTRDPLVISWPEGIKAICGECARGNSEAVI